MPAAELPRENPLPNGPAGEAVIPEAKNPIMEPGSNFQMTKINKCVSGVWRSSPLSLPLGVPGQGLSGNVIVWLPQSVAYPLSSSFSNVLLDWKLVGSPPKFAVADDVRPVYPRDLS